MDTVQENELIARILQGQRDDYAILVEKYKKPIFNLTYWMTGNRQDADDLAQETFLRAYLKLHRFDRQQRFFPWLYAICLNLTRSHLRKKKDHPTHRIESVVGNDEETPLSSSENNTERDIIAQERCVSLRETLLQLNAEDREVIVLRYFDERSLEDIAEIAGITLSAAKMRLYRGLEKMKTILEKREG
jgi:RNA polymerase sigma-70 factor (ECF subfamily)